jgi:hypothetical protein
MAEIKSTLDLIMEKTKNLTMTEEEKNTLKCKEWKGKIKGWIQKLIDGRMNLHELESNFYEATAEYSDIRPLFKEALIRNIHPDGNNSLIFQSLEKILGVNTLPFEDIIRTYQKNVVVEAGKRMEYRAMKLRQSEIFGSSVIPNINRDEAFRQYLRKADEDFRHQLASSLNDG